ncbi:electron transfer flavoprotein alpha subunit apoprotein [Colwellia chukchiensis]|uniref:Electron transfer flavoprotein subunit alpha n=1 Tax=Colwellia chukchiensis TaxID=641665 RepID=A0A1H7I125_9GAMM|nr:FAD-binding protein [Colwellia chukchiensis]SEK55100.1 electron transfer flavoprotein alpha subunit apoprotein [Colwellia chukchiensis]
MAILILAEHDNNQLNAATLHAVQAASQLGSELHLAVIGSQCQSVVAQAAKINNIKKVVVVDASCYQYQLAENVANTLAEIAAGYRQYNTHYSHVFAAASSTTKNIMPRVAALLDVGQISEIIAVQSADTFLRPIYAGNAIASVRSLDTIKVITVRSSAFDAAAITGGNAEIAALDIIYDLQLSRFESETLTVSSRADLSSAKVVIAGGRGLGDGKNFNLLEKVADKLNAAIGASRAAVDAGFVANDMQVGQTGKVVAPDLYIAVGISGAIQHLAGMKDSKIIVAINKDHEAPIFSVADYGLVADLFEVLPELAQAL